MSSRTPGGTRTPGSIPHIEDLSSSSNFDKNLSTSTSYSEKKKLSSSKHVSWEWARYIRSDGRDEDYSRFSDHKASERANHIAVIQV
jgi:hypothetical protein